MLDANRDIFKKQLDTLGRVFSKIPLSPNQWTLISLIPALISLVFILQNDYFIAALFLVFAVFLDVVDGSVARVTKKVSKFGGYLDSLVDRVVEFLILLGFFSIPFPELIIPSKYWIALLMFGSLMTPLTRAVASEKKVFDGELRGGILERAERVFMFALILMVSEFSMYFGIVLIAITSVFSVITFLQKFFMVKRMCK